MGKRNKLFVALYLRILRLDGALENNKTTKTYILFLVYSYDSRLIRNTTLLLVDTGSILYRRYDGLQ